MMTKIPLLARTHGSLFQQDVKETGSEHSSWNILQPSNAPLRGIPNIPSLQSYAMLSWESSVYTQTRWPIRPRTLLNRSIHLCLALPGDLVCPLIWTLQEFRLPLSLDLSRKGKRVLLSRLQLLRRQEKTVHPALYWRKRGLALCKGLPPCFPLLAPVPRRALTLYFRINNLTHLSQDPFRLKKRSWKL